MDLLHIHLCTNRAQILEVPIWEVSGVPERLGLIPETGTIFDFWSTFGTAQGWLETHKRSRSNDLD
jgi:hypothetical protein